MKKLFVAMILMAQIGCVPLPAADGDFRAAETVPSGTVAIVVSGPTLTAAVPVEVTPWYAQGWAIAIESTLGGLLLLLINSGTNQATIAKRQAVLDEVKQWEGMVVHAANVVKSSPTLDALPYADKVASFIGKFDPVFQNIFGRPATVSEQHDAVATAAQLGVLAPVPKA